MTDVDNVQTIVNTALHSAPPAELEPGKVYAFHTPMGVQKVDLSGIEYQDTPSRKTGVTTVYDAVSWLAYWAKHSDTDSEVYADAANLTVSAVLDAHTGGAARWEGHRLRLELRKTRTWQQWVERDGKLLAQDTFADFLEDHLGELLEPDAATMLEIAQSIQAVTNAEFKSGVRLQSGERQFQYVETINATAGKRGEITIPETFTVGLKPFEGAEGYKLTARLRYRIQRGGELTIGYKLDRPDDVLKSAFTDVLAEIEGQIETPVMHGSPAR